MMRGVVMMILIIQDKDDQNLRKTTLKQVNNMEASLHTSLASELKRM
jgi:hypothetical protein